MDNNLPKRAEVHCPLWPGDNHDEQLAHERWHQTLPSFSYLSFNSMSGASCGSRNCSTPPSLCGCAMPWYVRAYVYTSALLSFLESWIFSWWKQQSSMEKQQLRGLCWFTSGKLLAQFSILCSRDIFTLYLHRGLQANSVLNSSPQGSPSYVPGLKAQLLMVPRYSLITGDFEGNCPRRWFAGVGNLSDLLPLLSVLFQ